MNTFIKQIPFLLVILYCFLIANNEEGCGCKNPFKKEEEFNINPNLVKIGEPAVFPVWSPDGTKIYYISEWYTMGGVIYVIDTNGQNKQVVKYGYPDGKYSHLTISLDGKKLAAVKNGLLMLMNSDGSNEVKISPDSLSNIQASKFLPSGKELIFNVEYSSFYYVNLDTFNVKFLFKYKSDYDYRYDFGFDVSPDGKDIAFIQQNYLEGTAVLIIRRIDGSYERIFNMKLYDSDSANLKYSPEGKRIAIAKGDGYIELLSPTSGNVLTKLDVRICANRPCVDFPSWSESGKKMVFSADCASPSGGGCNPPNRLWILDNVPYYGVNTININNHRNTF